MSRLTLLNTPSSGVDEVLKALLNAHAYGARYATAARLKRHLPPRTTTADITTALTAAEGSSYAQDNGSAYQLTATGHTRARSKVPNRYVVAT